MTTIYLYHTNKTENDGKLGKEFYVAAPNNRILDYLTLNPIEPDLYLQVVHSAGRRRVRYASGLLPIGTSVAELSRETGKAQQWPIGEGGKDLCPIIKVAKEVNREIYSVFLEAYQREKAAYDTRVAQEVAPFVERMRVLQSLLREAEQRYQELLSPAAPPVESMLERILLF